MKVTQTTFDGLEDAAEQAAGQTSSGAIALVTGLEVDEPIFVLRARDALALGFLVQYRSMAAFGELFDQPRSDSLARDVEAFVKWRRAHVDRVRDPD